jgi:error-prone DNA polymerase
MACPYVELEVTSNYGFLRAASHPEELATAAAEAGYEAIGIAERNSLAGVVRMHVAAKAAGLRLAVGARLVPRDGPQMLCYPRDRAAYARLCRLLTLGKRRARKGDCELYLEDIEAAGEGQSFVLLPSAALHGSPFAAGLRAALMRFATVFPSQVWLAARALYRGDDRRRLDALADLAESCRVPLVATGDVAMHAPERKPLLDLVTCIREGVTIDEAGLRLEANAERYLKRPEDVAHLFRDHPRALAESRAIAERSAFSLDELRYEYPEELGATGESAQATLERLTWEGARRRYPGGLPAKVRRTLEHELRLIAELGYAPYFLTVEDLVRFARSRGILCQGRGSAANSAVCYCLGVTAVDPARLDLLFERFVSAERGEPPDIDVDFEHERREEVIQYIYAKYGRDRAGLTATVICYRGRGAVRDAGKAMGLSADTVQTLAGSIWGWSGDGVEARIAAELGLDPRERRLRQTIALTRALIGFPRHLSQHVGGFVMTRGPLSELVPIENAAMEGRTVIEWDKDDLDALGILKVDVLALGMLTCLKKGFDLIAGHHGRSYSLADVPTKDPAVYDMLCKADSIGVFQVESRAQMTMLPRLKPRDFYDLVIEVAIVRPGPIQGDMVHPYLRRRNGEEKVSFPSEALRRVLGKTLGVPLFQEQAMQIAIVAAGFTPSEADRLRRAMATFKKNGDIGKFRDKLVGGMVARGYEAAFAERCFKQIEGFGTYGFPESHAASFALLVYVSAWMKCHYPAVFACALLNSQPMGFYAPAQIVRDAREHGVAVRPVDINHSLWDCTLEDGESAGGPALRLGLRQVRGLAEEEAARLLAGRGGGYEDPLALKRRAGLSKKALEALARADALRSLGLDRREALWAVKALPAAAPLPLFAAAGEEERGAEPIVRLPRLSLSEHVVADYASLRLSLKAHPLSFLRGTLAREGLVPAAALAELADGARVALAGLVLVRQRPGSAKGVIFATLEDETGVANIVVWPDCFERFRATLLKSCLLAVEGKIQKQGIVIHLVAEKLSDMTERLHELGRPRRPLAAPVPAHADEAARRPEPQPPPRHPRRVNPMPRSRDFR